MKITIAEEALQTGKGHWPGYIGSLADDFRKSGDEVDVLTHGEATERVLKRVGGTAWFTRNCWTDPASQGTAGGLRHNFIYRKELLAWLRRQEPPPDWVLALTMRVQHLLAFALMSRNRKLVENTRFLLLFVQGFGHYEGIGKATTFSNSGSTRMARWCFRMMAPAVRRKRIILAAETRGMQDELQRFTGLPAHLFPHPVPLPTYSRARGDHREITVTAPGFGRHEKGTDLLQEAICRLLEEPAMENVRFILQWPEPFDMPDGTRLEPNETLRRSPRVDLVNENLGPGEYEELIDNSSLVILPYRRNSYHNRLSRVAIEAAGRGKPLIYTTGTWTGEVAEIAGTGMPIHEETGEACAEAIRKAVTAYAEIAARAADGAPAVARFHTGDTFREHLKGAAR